MYPTAPIRMTMLPADVSPLRYMIVPMITSAAPSQNFRLVNFSLIISSIASVFLPFTLRTLS